MFIFIIISTKKINTIPAFFKKKILNQPITNLFCCQLDIFFSIYFIHDPPFPFFIIFIYKERSTFFPQAKIYINDLGPSPESSVCEAFCFDVSLNKSNKKQKAYEAMNRLPIK